MRSSGRCGSFFPETPSLADGRRGFGEDVENTLPVAHSPFHGRVGGDPVDDQTDGKLYAEYTHQGPLAVQRPAGEESKSDKHEHSYGAAEQPELDLRARLLA